MMRRRRSQPAVLTLSARTSQKKVAGMINVRRETFTKTSNCSAFFLVMRVFPLLSAEQKPVGKIIKFGTNIDLSDPKR